MKLSAFIKSLGLAVAFCFGLIHTGYAQAPVYTLSVTTPSGPNDVKAGATYYSYTSSATLNHSNNLGELIVNVKAYTWVQSITTFTGKSSDPNGGFNPVSQYDVLSTFLTTDSPPQNLATKNPTTLRVDFKSARFYQITLSCTVTFDLLNQDGTVNQANLSASGYATCQVNVDREDFSISDTDQLVIPIEGNANTTINGYSINGFQGNVALGLQSPSTPNPADPAANPAGVSGSGSIFVLNPGPTTAPMNIQVGSNAVPGTYPLTIYGVGTDEMGISPVITCYTTISVTIPRRYVEITNSNDANGQNSSKTGPNTRSPKYDGSMSIDSVAGWRLDSADPSDAGHYTGSWHGTGSLSTQSEQGFKSSKNYLWVPKFGGSDGGKTYPNFTPSDFNQPTLELDDKLTSVMTSGPALGKSTSVTVQVANSGSSFHTDNVYNIRWHYPYENWVAQGTSGMLGNPSYETYPGSGYVTSGQPANVSLTIPTSSITDSLGIIGSAVLGVAGTAVGTTGGAELVGLSIPVSATAAALLVAASYTVAAVAPAAPGTIPSFPTNVDNFKDSILIQQQLTAHPSSTYYVNSNRDTVLLFDPNAPRFAPGTSSLTLTDTTSPWYFSKVWAGLQGPVQVEVVPGRFRIMRTFKGDHYGPTGYIGQASTDVHFPGSYAYIYHWKIGSFSPPPNS